jgi:putative membrane protein
MTRLRSTSAAFALAALCASHLYAQNTSARDFINEMAIANMAEVELGRLATSRARSADVKAFGEMMVKDHTQANMDLSRIASQMNVTLPKELDQKHKDLSAKLSKLTGAAFDREYVAAMVMGHQEVEGKLRARATTKTTSTSPGASTATTGTSSTPGSTLPGDKATTGTSGSAPQGERDVNEWATKTLPTVQHHLNRAKELQKTVK